MRVAELSNVDNMAFVGILSTQLLWKQFVEKPPTSYAADKLQFTVCVDYLNAT
jgi:hypothetical protein